MTLTSIFRADRLEPPPWLYARMARGSLFRLVYRRFVADLAASLPPGSRVLDVGTGPGFLLEFLVQTRPDLDLWGLDLARDMIRRARPRPEAPIPGRSFKWVVADALALPFPARSFDLALATFSFHLWRRPADGLAEMGRIVKPGGWVWIYELRREVPVSELQAFAREEKLPFLLVYLGFLGTSRLHALSAGDFRRILSEAAGGSWQLHPVHRLFWRAELNGPVPPAGEQP
jgi:ubiquinone/menaquinone biosynthesis C-methylase UbiE